MDDKNITFAQAMKKLEEINSWFQNEDIDLDKGLARLQEGKEMIALCRMKLKAVENEFITIKEAYSKEDTASSDSIGFDHTDTTSIIETHEETIITTTDEIPF